MSVAALRNTVEESSEMISQLLFGETFIARQSKDGFTNIICDFDDVEGWISDLQWEETISLEEKLVLRAPYEFSKGRLYSVGSEIDEAPQMRILSRETIIQSALEFIDVPFLKGGRSFFGLDSQAFVQLVFKANGYNLPRFASKQAEVGEVLAFIEEAQQGDLAFFDDCNGVISHVGIILSDFRILHCYGKVRIDEIDSSGIYNKDLGKHTHKLRFVKSLLTN